MGSEEHILFWNPGVFIHYNDDDDDDHDDDVFYYYHYRYFIKSHTRKERRNKRSVL